ncbi:hypothetical protein [Paenirhodobacter enshiensis]|uniref:hypothetical protein n=1 Tax=Paenirhodobacter enshiensis TaxID=1105367 RepID=UPI001268E340|nr:hypothetical protein [Paenirhodobacter enshiensis]
MREEHRPPEGFRFAIGKDRQGRWLLRDRLGLVDGNFHDRARAIDCALRQSDRQPMQVYCLPDERIEMAEELFPNPWRTHVAVAEGPDSDIAKD